MMGLQQSQANAVHFQHINGHNSVKLTAIGPTFGVVVAESHPQHQLLALKDLAKSHKTGQDHAFL